MNWQTVEGTMISAVAYNATTKDLYLRFVKSGEWRYANVEITTYDALIAAPSKGKYFLAHIKGKFSDTKI